jgi:predicted DNA-binding protein YlxM (UPF0122 family)
MEGGVYKIVNKSNNKIYVGSTKDFVKRFKSHKYSLNSSAHSSQKLQRAWDKYGKDAFEFQKILCCDTKNLMYYEQQVLDFYKAATKGYNICGKAYSREGVPHSKEVVNKMTAFQRSYRKKYQWKGQDLCISEIAEQEKIPSSVLYRRVELDGLDLEEAVLKPYKKPNQKIEAMGLSLTITEWSKKIGCSIFSIRTWLKNGLTIEQCVDKHKKITVGEFARLSGANVNLFSARIRAGWGIARALGEEPHKLLTKEQAAEIRKLSKSISAKEIAKTYGVHPDTIGLILKNISFKETA